MPVRRLALIAVLGLALPVHAAAPPSTAPDPLPGLANEILSAGPGEIRTNVRAPFELSIERCMQVVYENDSYTGMVTKVAEMNRESGKPQGIGQVVTVSRRGLWVHAVEEGSTQDGFVRSNSLCDGSILGYQAVSIPRLSGFVTLRHGLRDAPGAPVTPKGEACLAELRREAAQASQAAVLGREYRGSMPVEAYFEVKGVDVRLVTVMRPRGGEDSVRQASCVDGELTMVEGLAPER